MLKLSLQQPATAAAPWMRKVLLVAGIYNLAWGAFVVLFPLTLFQWAGLRLPTYPEIWQCVGMIVGVYGVAGTYPASCRFGLCHQ